MTTPENIRIGDREREDAITALGAHFTAGRLDVDEYGERTAKATVARVRGDIHALFADLPESRPALAPPTRPASAGTTVPAGQFRRREAAGATVVLVWVVALALMFILRTHYVIFIPIVLTALLWGFWGRGQHYGRRRRYRG